MDEVGKELGCECLKRSTTDKNDHSAVARQELNKSTELNVG